MKTPEDDSAAKPRRRHMTAFRDETRLEINRLLPIILKEIVVRSFETKGGCKHLFEIQSLGADTIRSRGSVASFIIHLPPANPGLHTASSSVWPRSSLKMSPRRLF